MVNASLNWASIVGIVLAVGGALLYFMRSFKPALARDYDVFFAAIGLLCGGILFFQGWRLDPILQFGQFLLAGTTVFFAYESVRLRGVTTEQARRSSYFDDEEPAPAGPYRPRMGGSAWGEQDVDRFDEPQPLRRRIPARDEEDDFYRPRRSSRAAIPERAASRRSRSDDDWERPDVVPAASRPPASDFGARRRDRDSGPEPRRGSRPVAAADAMPRSSRRPGATPEAGGRPGVSSTSAASSRGPRRQEIPQGTPIRDAGGRDREPISDADFAPIPPAGGPGPGPGPTTWTRTRIRTETRPRPARQQLPLRRLSSRPATALHQQLRQAWLLAAMLPSLLLPLLGGCSGPWGRRPASPGLIGSGEHQRDPALSGDGRVLATVRDGRGAARVLLQEQPGGRILPLRHLGGQRPQRSPALSWRGRYLAAIVQQGPRRVVLIEDRLSGRPLRLPLPTGDEPQQLSLAPDGQRLAVELWREGQPRVELYDLSGLLERDLPPGLRLPQAPGGTP